MEEAIRLTKLKIESLNLDYKIPYQGENAYDEINFAINKLEDLLFEFEQIAQPK